MTVVDSFIPTLWSWGSVRDETFSSLSKLLFFTKQSQPIYAKLFLCECVNILFCFVSVNLHMISHYNNYEHQNYCLSISWLVNGSESSDAGH